MTVALSDIKLSSWMADSYESIKNLTLKELSLPGAHNSGMDRKAHISDMWRTCQYDSFRYQMDNGIRVLDIRLAYYAGTLGWHGEKYAHRHGINSGRHLHETLMAIEAFLERNPEEFIIVDFHEISPAHSVPVPYEELAAYIQNRFKDKLLPYSALNLTLAQLSKSYPGRKIIIAATSEFNAKDWAWPKIEHQWIGQNLVSADDLGRFIDRVMESPPSYGLWSMSATGYSVIGPTNLAGELDSWYAASSPYQMKSNIINVDWFDNSRLVRNCIETNIEKGRRKVS